jgi:hypothetical protein
VPLLQTRLDLTLKFQEDIDNIEDLLEDALDCKFALKLLITCKMAKELHARSFQDADDKKTAREHTTSLLSRL